MCLTKLITDREFPHEGTAYKVIRLEQGAGANIAVTPFERTPVKTGKWVQASTEPERISDGRGPEYRNGFHLYTEMPSEEALRKIYVRGIILVEVRYRGALAYGMSRTFLSSDEPTLVVREIFIPRALTPVGRPE